VTTVKLLMLAAAATLIMACSSQPAFEPSGSVPATTGKTDPAKRWIGKGVDDLVNTLGEPTEVITLQENEGGGGKMFLYEKPGQPHMIFQTDPGSQTIDKAQTVE
jgi:hypothetical protein